MNRKTFVVVNGALIAVMVAASAAAHQLGAPGAVSLLGGALLPVIALLNLLIGLLPFWVRAEAWRLEGSQKGHLAIWTGAIALLAIIHAAAMIQRAGVALDLAAFTGLLVGVFLMVMGNYSTKLRQGYVYGVLTPWTRRSALSWNKTHRLFGWMLVVMGALVVASSLAGQSAWLGTFFFGGIALCILVPSALSYYFWKQDPARREVG